MERYILSVTEPTSRLISKLPYWDRNCGLTGYVTITGSIRAVPDSGYGITMQIQENHIQHVNTVIK